VGRVRRPIPRKRHSMALVTGMMLMAAGGDLAVFANRATSRATGAAAKARAHAFFPRFRSRRGRQVAAVATARK